MHEDRAELEEITDDQAKYAMGNGEFPDSVIASASHVAVILT